MNLPEVISDLVKAQNDYNSVSYANSFAETAVVLDEGNTHKGRTEIQHWIADANEKYKTVLLPLRYEETDNESILTTNVSGTFDGSPIVMKYHIYIVGGLIQSLKITG